MQAGRSIWRNPEHPQYSTDADFRADWLGGIGNWSNGLLWSTSPAYPNNGNGVTYDAIIGGGTVTLNRDIAIQKLYLNGGFVNGLFDLTLNEGLDWIGGGLSSSGTINLGAGSTSTISGVWPTFAVILSGPTINNFGSVFQNTDITNDAKVLGTINNIAGAAWNIQDHGLPDAITFNNAGDFLATDSEVDGPFNNSGNVTIQSTIGTEFFPYYTVYHGLQLSGGGIASGTFDVAANAALIFYEQGPIQTYTFTTGATVTGAGSVVDYGVMIDVAGDTMINPHLEIYGGLTVQPGVTLTLNGGLSLLSGHMLLQGGTINSSRLLFSVNCSLMGFGTINGDLSGTDWNLVPLATGTLTTNGSVDLYGNAYLIMEIGGNQQGNGYSYLFTTGTVYVDQYSTFLFVNITNDFQLQLKNSDTFTVAHADGGFSGMFANVANGQRLYSTDRSVSFEVNYGEGSPYGANNLVLSSAVIIPLMSGLTFPADAGLITPPFVASDGNVWQNVETTDPSLGGRAAYRFVITNPGEYVVSALVDAPGDGNNSLFINIDSEPTTPTMIWDIVSYTNGLEWRTACWRGTGTFDNPQIVPQKFALSTGVHELIIRGREANTILGTITIAPDYLMTITSLTKNSDGSFTLEWSGRTGRMYDVERSSDPGFQNPTVLAAGVPGTAECSFTDPASDLADVQSAFYRVKLVSSP